MEPWRIEELSVDACMEALHGADFGRLAFVRDGEPDIRPLTVAFVEGAVVARMEYGPTLDLLADRPHVVFEIDGADDAGRDAWSVIVRGRAEEVSDPAELDRLRALPLAPWAPGERAHYVRVLPRAITGRRIVRPAQVDGGQATPRSGSLDPAPGGPGEGS
jgi:uncharacterized protein